MAEIKRYDKSQILANYNIGLKVAKPQPAVDIKDL